MHPADMTPTARSIYLATRRCSTPHPVSAFRVGVVAGIGLTLMAELVAVMILSFL
jgi:hypothetical protein